MFLVPFLLLSLCESQSFTLFLAPNIALTSTPTVGAKCASADGNQTGFEYRALVMLSNQRNLHTLLNGSVLVNIRNQTLASNFKQFLNGNRSSPLYFGDNTTTAGNSTTFWSGAFDEFANYSEANCADFTVNYPTLPVSVRNVASSIAVNCSQTHALLCARGLIGSFPNSSSASSNASENVYVFLSATSVPANNHTFDPDVFCRDQATSSNVSRLQGLMQNGSVVQAVAFTARRQNLHDMFPPNKPIYDLDNNQLAANSVELFNLVSAVSMRDSSGQISDSSKEFFTGTWAGDTSGNSSGVTCGDYTTDGMISYSKVFKGIYAGTIPCNNPARFLCAANVLAPPPSNGSASATYLFFSAPVIPGIDVNASFTPDNVCSSYGGNNSKLIGRQIIALALSNNRTSLDVYSTGVVEDLNNNTIAQSLSELWNKSRITTRSLTVPNGTHVDINVEFWSGAAPNGSLTSNCGDYSNSSDQGQVGTLQDGKATNVRSCQNATRFLCAALVPPTMAPTASPTAFPTASPTSPPTIPSAINATWNGTATTLVVAGNGTTPIEVTISPDTTFGQNGTVQVIVLGNSTDTISPVVSVVFRGVSGDIVNVTNLTNPITVSFLILNNFLDNVKHCVETVFVEQPIYPQCGYRTDNNTWDTKGCKVASVNATWLKCECTHLTDFALLSPKSNKVVPTDTLELTPANIAANSTGLVAVVVILVVFAVVFALAWRRDRQEALYYQELRLQKETKWASFAADKHKATFVKQVKIAFQKRHTWFSLIFRKKGTSFKSVDRTFVALLSVFASMSMSALFHAQDNNRTARVVAWALTVCVCLVPAQVLMELFVHTGEMGFFEQWEYVIGLRKQPSNKCTAFRFSGAWRYVWRGMTIIAVVGMIIHVLTMSMRFDLQPFFFCQGAPAQAWVGSWLGAYATTVFVYEPLRLLLMAAAAYCADTRESLKKSVVELTSRSKAEQTQA